MDIEPTRVVIYTANMGGYDVPHPQRPQDIDVSWHYFADGGPTPPGPWIAHRAEQRHRSANLSAKWFKTHPPTNVEYAIWLDANMQVVSPSFAREAIAACGDMPVCTSAHPRRQHVRDEVDASLGGEGQGGRYDGEPLREQLAHYIANGFPDESGCYATGTTVWNMNDLVTPSIGVAWMDECLTWSIQDQVSFPYVCWSLGVRPATFPWSQLEPRQRGWPRTWFGNRHVQIRPHARTPEELSRGTATA